MSLGRLAEAALQQGFAEQCTLTRDSLQLVIEGRTFAFGWADGQQFLRLLLSGAGRVGFAAERFDVGRAERERAERERTEAERLERERQEREARAEAERQARARREREQKEQADRLRAEREQKEQAGQHARSRNAGAAGGLRGGRLQDDYLDTMLTFAARAGLIEGFEKDDDHGKVTLRTHATTTDLSYAETLEYLTSVVLDELSSAPTASAPFRLGGQTSISVLPSR